MEESELWKWVAREMKIDAVPDPIKRKTAYMVHEILDSNQTDTPEELLSLVREEMKFVREMEAWKEGRSPTEHEDKEDETTSTETYFAELASNEALRSQAIEEYIAKIASLEYRVYRFRERFLQGGVLSPTQAREFVYSIADRELRQYALQESTSMGDDIREAIKVPTKSQEAKLLGRLDSRTDVTQPPKSQEAQLRVRHEQGSSTPVNVAADSLEAERNAELAKPREQLLFPDEEGHPQEIFVFPSSVLNGLRRISSELSTWYSWQEHQAAWFVLTGEQPAVPALAGSSRISYKEELTYGTVTLTIQPWVSAETVRRFYQQVQRQILPGKPRSPSKRNLALFRFVTKQTEVRVPEVDGISKDVQPLEPELERPSWRILLERWNREYPDWRYKDVWNFHRDFGRVEQVVVHPPYRLGSST